MLSELNTFDLIWFEIKKVSLYYVQNWQNCVAFNYSKLTFWRYQKLSHTNAVQANNRKYRKNEHFELQQILKMSSTSLHVVVVVVVLYSPNNRQ